ncbi:MAG: hypothetical protein NUV80_03650 [Candidatus Berkelbacteria bacterium]|nr:hypothetical protein [Candidatus Berkelbacteria bacterium]MCR4307631.1 hypothetical protein [Candidatus Berkelbacteria bacterium]
MKYNYQQFKDLLPELDWTIGELAEKLSLAGHEAEVVGKEQLDITITANRHDCQDLKYLVFDLAGVYGLKTIPNLVEYGHKEVISVTVEQVNRILGTNISIEELGKLEQLGFEVKGGSIAPPDFRDVETVADVAEEVVRQLGYDKLNIQPLVKQDGIESSDYQHLLSTKIALASVGLIEVATSSFTKEGVVEVNDPFSRNEPFLRPNLQTGLLKTLARNPYLKRAAFFEIGNVFTPRETTKLGIIIAGYKDVGTWQARISQAIGTAVGFSEIGPAMAEKLDAKQGRLNYFEISIDKLKPVLVELTKSLELPLPKFKLISKFPPLVRDITVENPGEDTVDELKKLEDLLFFKIVDEYQGRITYRLIFQKMTGSYSEAEIKAIDSSLESFQQH